MGGGEEEGELGGRGTERGGGGGEIWGKNKEGLFMGPIMMF